MLEQPRRRCGFIDDMTNFDLRRFTEAQGPVYKQVCRELEAGKKRTH